MPKTQDQIDERLREIFMEEWRVDGFGDQHVQDAMRRAYQLGRTEAANDLAEKFSKV